MKTETALQQTTPVSPPNPPRLATPGQMKEIFGLLPKGVPTELSFEAAAEIIGNKGAFIQKIASLFPDPAILSDQVKQWEKLYLEVFGLTIDISKVKLPAKREGFNRLIIVAKGMTLNGIYDACAKRFNCWRYHDDLDASVTENDRDANRDGTYAIWVRDTTEADEGLKNLSANDIKARKPKVTGETLMERMLHELKYFLETGKHLDIDNVTLCTGSRDSDGDVPYARWRGSWFYVRWYGADYADSYLRAREAVSL